MVIVILCDQGASITIFCRIPSPVGQHDVTIARPRLLGEDGAIACISLKLAHKETAAFQASAEIILKAIASLEERKA